MFDVTIGPRTCGEECQNKVHAVTDHKTSLQYTPCTDGLVMVTVASEGARVGEVKEVALEAAIERDNRLKPLP